MYFPYQLHAIFITAILDILSDIIQMIVISIKLLFLQAIGR
mgnify:FL=1